RRIARTLAVPVGVRSTPGRGSVFFVTVPYGYATAAMPRIPMLGSHEQRLSGRLVLVIDNEPSILAGMSALLESWHCRTRVAMSGDEALRLLSAMPRKPDLVIVDYHLDSGGLGVSEFDRIQRACGTKLPGIILTANRSDSVKEAAQEH